MLHILFIDVKSTCLFHFGKYKNIYLRLKTMFMWNECFFESTSNDDDVDVGVVGMKKK